MPRTAATKKTTPAKATKATGRTAKGKAATPAVDWEAFGKGVIGLMEQFGVLLPDVGVKADTDEPPFEPDEAPAVDAKTQKAHDKRKAELEKKTLRALKALATKEDGGYEFEDEDVADADKDSIVRNMLIVDFPGMYPDAEDEEEDDEEEDVDDESEDEDDDEADEEDEDEEEDEKVTRESLMALELAELKKVALKAGAYEKAKDMKGLDKDTIADAVMALESEDEEDEDDDEDGEDEYYTREDYEAMSLAELKAVADEAGVEYKKGVKQSALIEALLEG